MAFSHCYHSDILSFINRADNRIPIRLLARLIKYSAGFTNILHYCFIHRYNNFSIKSILLRWFIDNKYITNFKELYKMLILDRYIRNNNDYGTFD